VLYILVFGFVQKTVVQEYMVLAGR